MCPISDIKLTTGLYNIRSSTQRCSSLSFLPSVLVQPKGLHANEYHSLEGHLDLLLICHNRTSASAFSAYFSPATPLEVERFVFVLLLSRRWAALVPKTFLWIATIDQWWLMRVSSRMCRLFKDLF